ncbi:sigma-70 family RNA polymerase sigma factor [Erythrobacter sp. Alg231-14]|uniref:sigma-70 family RNA polymerase sigma factor n=1 Tax=Erythrobacter sp. Alg231-14 TaxID=1922225 RepID=UPI000D554C4A
MADRRPSYHANHTGELFDELLVVMIQRGDRRALDRLHHRWNTRLLRAARRYCGDIDAAADLVQDSWIGIWKGLPNLRNPARFRSYAFSVLHRRGADHLRTTIKERAAIQDHDGDIDVADTAPLSPPAQSESAAIAQAFAKLPPDQRLAAHLHYVEGVTLKEIAMIQSIPEGTAKSRLFHARRALKAALTDNF